MMFSCRLGSDFHKRIPSILQGWIQLLVRVFRYKIGNFNSNLNFYEKYLPFPNKWISLPPPRKSFFNVGVPPHD